MRGRGSASSDEFIREVDEAVRQDRWLKLWKEYGAYVVGAALAVVIGTAAGVGWRTWQESQRHGEAERYMAATQLLRQNQPAEAAAAFRALAEESDSGYAVLAHLQAARALGQAGDEAGKVAMLSQLADDDAAAPMYRELGDLLALQQQFGAESPDNLTSRLENLTSADNPWRYSALELIALAQMRAGDTDAARETLSTLVGDPRTPPDLGRRAAELLSAVGGPIGQAGDPQSKAPDEQEQETSDNGEGQ
jgi:hypothetical protein